MRAHCGMIMLKKFKLNLKKLKTFMIQFKHVLIPQSKLLSEDRNALSKFYQVMMFKI